MADNQSAGAIESECNKISLMWYLREHATLAKGLHGITFVPCLYELIKNYRSSTLTGGAYLIYKQKEST